VYIRCYSGIYKHDLDMLLPGSKPNPSCQDVLFVAVPFLAGFGAAIYKIISVRCSGIACGIHQVDASFELDTPFSIPTLLAVHGFCLQKPLLQCSRAKSLIAAVRLLTVSQSALVCSPVCVW
jgi:hypothetical protein